MDGVGADRKRGAEEVLRGAQRPRTDVNALCVVLEYHRHLARATAIVLTELSPGRCDVEAHAGGARLVFTAQGESRRVHVPWPLMSGTYESQAQAEAHVFTVPAAKAPASDELPRTPWATLAIEEADVDQVACAACDATLVALDTPALLRSLPSENWEELVDAWMCHGDQQLNASVVQGRHDVEYARIPHRNEIWVGTLWIKLASEQVLGVDQETHAYAGPWEVRTELSEGPAESQHGYPPWPGADQAALCVWLIEPSEIPLLQYAAAC